MKKTVPFALEIEPVETQSPSFWRQSLGVDEIAHDVVWLVNDWHLNTLITRAEYEAALAAMSFTAH